MQEPKQVSPDPAKAEGEVMKLSKPVEFEGEKITELRVDLEGLTGADLEAAEREWQASGGGGAMAEVSKAYLLCVAARATGKRVELLRRLSAKDYSRLTVTVQNFLLV